MSRKIKSVSKGAFVMTHENKLGMFIHWGLYSVTGIQDQVYARMDWPREKYEALIHKFNPIQYNPEEWVLLAKSAGMKYICFTAKHHDGFVCGIPNTATIISQIPLTEKMF